MTTSRERAGELIVFCDGFDEGGLYPGFTRRAREVAYDLRDALDQLDATCTALAAITTDRDRWRENQWREAHGEAWPR